MSICNNFHTGPRQCWFKTFEINLLKIWQELFTESTVTRLLVCLIFVCTLQATKHCAGDIKVWHATYHHRFVRNRKKAPFNIHREYEKGIAVRGNILGLISEHMWNLLHGCRRDCVSWCPVCASYILTINKIYCYYLFLYPFLWHSINFFIGA